MNLQLDDKAVIVLASSKGLGRASAEAFVREGARVVISSRTEANLERAKEAILDETGADEDRVVPIPCDLSDPDAVTGQLERAISALGTVDVLVTNSGGPPKIGFEEASIEQFDETYVTLLKSILLAVDECLPHLKENSGAITNIIAASTQRPEPNHILANTIRPGIYGLSKSLANEYAEYGLRSNCVCPKKVGPVTQQERERRNHIDDYAEEHGLTYDEARKAFISEIIPLGRAGSLEEFGNAVAYLSSEQASHITGQRLNLDGGYTNSLI